MGLMVRVQIGTGNIGDKFDYLSFLMSGLTGAGTAEKGYYANQLLGAGWRLHEQPD